MKTLLIILALLLPSVAFAQLSVPQGGTGRSTFTGNDFIYANTASFQRLTGTTTPYFANFFASNGTINGLTVTGTCTGCGATFPFTPQAYGNSTSTTLGFLNGFLSTASSTVNGGNLWGLGRAGKSTYGSLQHYFNTLSPGQWTGGTISDAGSGVASVSAGTGFIKATDSNVADVLNTDWVASTTVAFLSATSTQYLGIEYNSGVPRLVKKTTDTWDLDTEFPIGIAFRETGSVYFLNNPWNTGDAFANIIERFDSLANCSRDNRLGGLILSNTGTRNVAVTAGAILCRLSEFSVTAIDTAVAGSFDAYYQNGSGGFTKEYAQTQWENTKYDDGDGTLGSMTALSFASRWFYLDSQGGLVMMYGRENLTSLSLSLNEQAPSTLPDRIGKGGLLIGRFIIQASGSTPSQTQTAFGTAFTGASVTSHTNLSDLAWTSSGHTGTANTVPYFSNSGAALSVATSTLTCTGLISCTSTGVFGPASTISFSGTVPIANGGTNATSFSKNVLIGFNGTAFIATGTPQLTIGNLNATSTEGIATSTFSHALIVKGGIATSTAGAANKSFLARKQDVFSTTTIGTNTQIVFTGVEDTDCTFAAAVLTCASNTAYFEIEIWGGGGGGAGGGKDASSYNGGGGQGGSWSYKLVNPLTTTTYYYTVGGGGGGGADGVTGGNTGTAGSQSCFGTNSTACTTPLAQANGGNGGPGSGGQGSAATGGTAGDIIIAGDLGGGTFNYPDGGLSNYAGGSSGGAGARGGAGGPGGGTGYGSGTSGYGVAAAGLAGGGGGGGNKNAGGATGGAGAPGGMMITVYTY